MAELDLNLLRVFDALLQAGSVSGAAERLHLSVPAASRALGRLRRATGDPILVRAGRVMVPTPFASRSAPRLRELLDDAAALVGDAGGADPALWRRSFTIRINDGFLPIVAPALLTRVAAEAPGLTIRFAAEGTEDPDELRDGRVDLDVGAEGARLPDLHSRALFADTQVALVATDSAAGRAKLLTLEAFCACPQLSTSRRGRAHGPIDIALAALGRSRRVAAVVPTFTAAALLALEPGLLAPVPRVLAAHLVDRGLPLRWHPIPLGLPTTPIVAQWHQRLDRDPASRWLRDTIASGPLHVSAGTGGPVSPALAH